MKDKIIPYNAPGFTGVSMGADLIRRLAEHPNIAGVKDGTGNIAQLAEFRSFEGHDFPVFTGNAPTFLAALFVGVSGGMMPITNILPDAWVTLLEAFRGQDLEEARRLDSILLPMTKIVMNYGTGGIKAAMDILGFYGGLPLRPLKAPSPVGIEKIAGALKQVQETL